ncbi:molybdate ABC transporter substrate-binding protein [Thermovibrio sp.]
MRLIAFIITFLFAVPVFSKELTVSCAAGALDLMKEIGKSYRKQTGEEVIFNFSSSGRLAKQIEAGAPVDVFISASPFWSSYLMRKGLLLKETVRPVIKTELVVITARDSKLKSINQAKTVAVGNSFAPVGKYALESLKRLNLYKELKEKLVFAPNVRAITLWVISGNADAGIVYYSTYLKFKDKLRLLEVLPENSHEPILFTVGCTLRKPKECRKFEKFVVNQPESLLKKFGFEKVKWSSPQR